MTLLPSQFKPISSSDCARVALFKLKSSVPLVRFSGTIPGYVNVVVTVVPSFVVLLLPSVRSWPGGNLSMGTTFTGADADPTSLTLLFRTVSLGMLNVVVWVVPSSVMVLLPVEKGGCGGSSSMEIILTGSYAAMTETRERSAIATGLAKE